MNGLKIGTETYFDIKDVEISNCCLMLVKRSMQKEG